MSDTLNESPTPEQLGALWGVCVEWIKRQRPSCPESLYQVERVNEALPDLAEEVCAVVGYYSPESSDA